MQGRDKIDPGDDQAREGAGPTKGGGALNECSIITSSLSSPDQDGGLIIPDDMQFPLLGTIPQHHQIFTTSGDSRDLGFA